MKVTIQQITYDKIMHWINKTDMEVSGFGHVAYDEDTATFNVLDAYLLKQEGGAAHTDIDAAALGKLMYDKRNCEGHLRFWWHSHVNMAVFWSGTDRKTIEDMGKNGWCLATVFNKKYEMRSALAYKYDSEFGDGLEFVDDISTDIIHDIDLSLQAQWDAEFTANVSEKKYAPPVYNQGAWLSKYDTPLLTGDKAWDYIEPRATMQDPGLLGYGIHKEAKALGKSPQVYLDLINYGSSVQLMELEEQLEIENMKGNL